LYSERAKGVFAADMERYFDRAGFRTFVFRGSWDDLEQHLVRGRPLIVGVRDVGVSKKLHYEVVAGLNPEERIMLVNDPARRKLMKVRWSDFENAWKATDDWTLLALPREAN
jgi:hypothetical protein